MMDEQTAVLLIRLWREDATQEGFRVRLVRIDEEAPQGASFGAAADVTEVLRLVETWLNRQLAR